MNRRTTRLSRAGTARLSHIVEWYFERIYGRFEGPGVLPFYCDPQRVGQFAVSPAALARGDHHAVFKLLIALSMYQARRDRLLMEQQRGMSTSTVRVLTDPTTLARAARAVGCRHLDPLADFERGCSVFKVGDAVDCRERPGTACPVKTATVSLRRMGDMGKTPASALRRFGRSGSFALMLTEVASFTDDPLLRAEEAVTRIQSVWRVGEKLATLFVSALATPALAPGLTPWHPVIDGNCLVVIDTNAAAMVDALRPDGARTYSARAQWVRAAAERIGLRRFAPNVPDQSARLVQQALYYFGSRSNRAALGIPCRREEACPNCTPAPCFVTAATVLGSSATTRTSSASRRRQ